MDDILTKESEEKDTARFEELNKVVETERTEEQKTELGELKERYGKRMQKKIDKMHAETKAEKEENERLRARIEELENKPAPEKEVRIPESSKEETIEFGGKKFFTDKALIAQVKSGEITEDEAYTYQRKRDKEEIKADLRKEQAEETKKEEDMRLRKEDADRLMKEYPHFKKSHPDYNSEDPLFKLANELFNEAYSANPRGLSLAVKRAKEILRISDREIDKSEDHGVEGSHPGERSSKEKEVTLSDSEKEAAIRQFTRGDVMNPKTGRAYTENEAVAKALIAKKNRSQGR